MEPVRKSKKVAAKDKEAQVADAAPDFISIESEPKPKTKDKKAKGKSANKEVAHSNESKATKKALWDDEEDDEEEEHNLKTGKQDRKVTIRAATADESEDKKKKSEVGKKSQKLGKQNKGNEVQEKDAASGKKTKASKIAADIKLRINEEYAKKYEERKEKEELSKLKDVEDEEDSEEEDEDEDAEELTPEIDTKITKVLMMIRQKDPKVYDSSLKFFDETEAEANAEQTKPKEKEYKPMFIRDVIRTQVLEAMETGKAIEDPEDEDRELEQQMRPSSPSYQEKQQMAKRSFSEKLRNINSDSEDEDGFLTMKSKSNDQLNREEAEYTSFLKEELIKKKISSIENNEIFREISGDNLDEKEKFLRDYVLFDGWKKRTRDSVEAPKDEIIQTVEDVEKEEEEIEFQEEFERIHNFRFEEPNAHQIVNYPRKIPESVRRDVKAEKRKEQREKHKEKEEHAKVQKAEELKRLKNLKKKEIMKKLDAIKQISGVSSLPFSEADLEGDFDPDEFQRKMESAFNDEYYDDVDDSYAPIPEYDDVEEDAEDKSGKKSKKKGDQKPALPKDLLDEYLEETFKLGYSDMIGDTPVRFKYVSVKPSSYGMSVEEILDTEDKELNQRISLKKLAPYHSGGDQKQRGFKGGKRWDQRSQQGRQPQADASQQRLDTYTRPAQRAAQYRKQAETGSYYPAGGSQGQGQRPWKPKRKAQANPAAESGSQAGPSANDDAPKKKKTKKAKETSE